MNLKNKLNCLLRYLSEEKDIRKANVSREKRKIGEIVPLLEHLGGLQKSWRNLAKSTPKIYFFIKEMDAFYLGSAAQVNFCEFFWVENFLDDPAEAKAGLKNRKNGNEESGVIPVPLGDWPQAKKMPCPYCRAPVFLVGKFYYSGGGQKLVFSALCLLCERLTELKNITAPEPMLENYQRIVCRQPRRP